MAQTITDFGAMTDDTLANEIARLEQEYQRTRFDHAVQGLGNPMEIRSMRRDIARGFTEVRRREIAAMTPEDLANRSKIRLRRRRTN